MNEEPAFLPELFSVAHARSLECLTHDEFWDYAFEVARRSHHASHSLTVHAHGEEYLLCEVGVGHCLLPLASLHEVIAPPAHYTKLPATPAWTIGVMAWRGELVVVVDLAAYLFGESAATQTMMVIAQHNTFNVALCVAAIQKPITLEANKINSISPHHATPTVRGRYMEALVLDTEALVTDIVQQIGMFSPYA